VSPRGRAIGFLLAALVAAVAAGTVAQGYGQRVAEGYGALRPVVVAADALRRGDVIDPELAGTHLELRRVPIRFVPAGALGNPAEAVGLVPDAAVPPGAYLLAEQLRPPRRPAGSRLGRGRRPVEIAVSGAGALLAGGVQPVGRAVDVAVTSEPSDSGEGRTYVAAAGVPLLGLAPEEAASGSEGTALATLGLTRPQALRLIAAQSFARRVTVIPRP
jgi:Flp pilus assembly protein CpaB